MTVSPGQAGVRIPAGYLGLSIEWWAVEAYAGRNPNAINPVLVQLIRNLIPDQTGVLRIGGVTTDGTWWPVAGVPRPPGDVYNLSERRLEVLKALAQEVGARLILGVNLEQDSRTLAAAEARAMLATVGRSRIAAFELGNEPELWGNPNFAWYTRDGHNVPGRPPGWDMATFTSDFANVGSALPQVGLAGPAAGAAEWLDQLGDFIAGEPRLAMVTVHRYPFEACSASPAEPWYPALGRLLSAAASVGQVAGVQPSLALAHAHHLPLRIDEMNTVACGNPPGIPDTFAMALWAIDSLYAYAQAGVDGVNVHTWPGAIYQLFAFKHLASGWRALVEPEYYGLWMFAQGAPAGSRLLQTSSADTAVRVWATRAADGTIRITLINDDQATAHRAAVHVAGARGAASVERLLAPGAGATTGVTLGGQSLSQTTTGQPVGPFSTTTITPSGGTYQVSLPPASAALLTLG
ncbi:MAG: glycosyl hydrolase family 79 C-terminal domain-containing protein [Solirubrobacteraceae bacterium]